MSEGSAKPTRGYRSNDDDQIDRDDPWYTIAAKWLVKQKSETVVAFVVLGFVGYWVLYEHPKTVDRNKAWHKEENVRTTEAIKEISDERNKVSQETAQRLEGAIKESAKIHEEAIKEGAKAHAEEVEALTDHFQKTLDRFIEYQRDWQRDHLRSDKPSPPPN